MDSSQGSETIDEAAGTAPDGVAILAFDECEALAQRVAARLRLPCRAIETHVFPDGESLVRAVADGAERVLVFRSLDHPNARLVELLLAADALRRQGVSALGLVAPYLGYMRQDHVFQPGEPLSQRVVARLLSDAFDDVLTVEAHLHRIRTLAEVFTCPARSLPAAAAIADWIAAGPRPSVVIGPDAESEPWVRAIAEPAALPWCVGRKQRHGDRDVHIELPALPTGVGTALLVDDVASSGTTLEALARILAGRGVPRIEAVVVHALFSPDAERRLAAAGIARIVSSDGIRHPTNEIPLAPTLARAIEARWLSKRPAET
ncbi:MAG: ribose-phosphate diphosphokinase [Myxococcota bacterium]|nr:ribose-phosphate diphosphokinase [Myxococcales bacterium]